MRHFVACRQRAARLGLHFCKIPLDRSNHFRWKPLSPRLVLWIFLAVFGFIFALSEANPATSGEEGELAIGSFSAAEDSFAIPILFSRKKGSRPDHGEWDVLYPLMSYDRYGREWRWNFVQIFRMAGGEGRAGKWKRATVFPFYFWQKSADPEKDYWALLPFYGTVKNRFGRDEVKTAAFPLYVRTRKKDVVTRNYLAPFFHLRRGDRLRGWQLWPLAGWETKGITTKTNILGESLLVGGHKKLTIAWPFYFRDRTGIGAENAKDQRALLPFFSSTRSAGRDSFTAPWPIGLTVTQDREKKYREIGLPWPFVVFARGEGKSASRLWPFFGTASNNKGLRSRFYVWPIYRRRTLETELIVERQTRWGFFLFAEKRKMQKDGGISTRERNLWPLFTWRASDDGGQRLQVLAVLEPFFPANETIERHYSPLWAVWRSSQSPGAKARSQSFLWNLWRREVDEERRRGAVLFGLVRWERTATQRSLKVLGLDVCRRVRRE